MANPWMKFHPQDWRADERLRMCSLPARGLWLEMMCIMHRAEKYGFLLIAGKAPTDTQLAFQVGTTPEQVSQLLAELRAAEVYSATSSGVIYSRRMVRDEKKSKINAKNGKKGGEASLGKTREKEHSRKRNSSDPLSLRSQKIDSVTKVTGEPPSLKEQLFVGCLAYIVGCGSSEKNARALIGMWRKSYGEAETVRRIGHCQANGVSDPAAYIRKMGSAVTDLASERQAFLDKKYGAYNSDLQNTKIDPMATTNKTSSR